MPRLSPWALPALLVLLSSSLLLAVPVAAAGFDDWPIYRGGPEGDRTLVPDRVVVQFAPGSEPQIMANKAGVAVTDDTQLNALSESYAVHTIGRMFPVGAVQSKRGDEQAQLARVYTLDFDGDRNDLREVLAEARKLPGVEWAEPVPIHALDVAILPDDPSLDQQTWLRNTLPGGRDIRAVAGWSYETGNANGIIAIADTGVDWQHPDLGGTGPDYIDGNIWINQVEWNGSPGVDDDGNGYVDDFRGWDFVTGVSGEQTPPQDTSTPDNDPMDYEGHGTLVAGCAAAMGNNGIGVAGAAYNAKIMALKVGWYPVGGPGSLIRMDFAASALTYATNNGARVFNASWGNSAFTPFALAVSNAIASGVVIVTSAGNDGVDPTANPDDEYDPQYLYNITGAISVAATNSGDTKASFSEFGTWVEVSAPGVGIYATTYNRFASGQFQHTYGASQGTSFSSPIVAGMVGLIVSANPGWSAALIRNTLMASVDDIDFLNPTYAGKLGTGRINMRKIFNTSSTTTLPGEVPTLIDGMNTVWLEADPKIHVLGGHTVTENFRITEANGLEVLGGWDATYTGRDPQGNPSILEPLNTLKPPLVIQGGVTNATVFDGFSIQNGEAEIVVSVPETGFFGGGVRVQDASPTLKNLTIQNCTAGDVDEISGGGGMAIVGGDPVLENIEISGCTGLRGAGLYIWNSGAQLTNVNVHDNLPHASGLFFDSEGGGIYILDSGLGKQGNEVQMTDVAVSGHTVGSNAGGIYSSNSALIMDAVTISDNTSTSNGGGIFMSGGSLVATDLTLDTNLAGSGLYANGTVVSIVGGTVRNNTAGLFGGGLQILNTSNLVLSDLFITDNSSALIGSGVYISNSTNSSLTNLTVANNNGGSAGGNGVVISTGDATVSNSIFALNGGGGTTLVDGLACSGSAVTVTCNLFFSNDAGNVGGDCPDPIGSNGNVEADPLFCEAAAGDYRIPPNSPAAAAQSGCGTVGADAESCEATGIDDGVAPRPVAFELRQNVPNPFNPSTSISFALPRPGRTVVRVYDVRGRAVVTLLDQNLPVGEHAVRWDGRSSAGNRVASGVYFYEVTSGDFRAVRKMGLVK